jgi:hypothetical protein
MGTFKRFIKKIAWDIFRLLAVVALIGGGSWLITPIVENYGEYIVLTGAVLFVVFMIGAVVAWIRDSWREAKKGG